MQAPAANYDSLVERFTIWAAAEPNVRAATIIGSRAREVDPADEWSDLDILVLAKEPSKYLEDGQWLDQIGRVWLTHVEQLPVGGGRERRAIFDEALEVDFAIVSSRRIWLARVALVLLSRAPAVGRFLPRDFHGQLVAMSDTLSRGARVLVDKDNLTSPLPRIAHDILQSGKPSEAEFFDVTDRFWHGSVWVAKHLRRGELWRAKDGCDVRMKTSMLQLIEWHAKATKGWDLNTWTLGRFLERWADPRVVAALGDAFGRYETEDVWRALFATMELFRWLARETAHKLNLKYRTLVEERAAEWVGRCFSERHQAHDLGSA